MRFEKQKLDILSPSSMCSMTLLTWNVKPCWQESTGKLR